MPRSLLLTHLTMCSRAAPNMQSNHPFHLHHLLGACHMPISMTDVWHVSNPHLSPTSYVSSIMMSIKEIKDFDKFTNWWQMSSSSGLNPQPMFFLKPQASWNTIPNSLLTKTLGFLQSLIQFNLFYPKVFLITSNLVNRAYSELLLLLRSESLWLQ